MFENAAILCFMTHPSKCCPDGQNNLETKCTGKIDIKCPKELGQKIVWLPAEGRKRLSTVDMLSRSCEAALTC